MYRRLIPPCVAHNFNITRNFARVKIHGEKKTPSRTKPLTSEELIKNLDSATQTQGGIPKGDKSKLTRNLTTPERGAIDPAFLGHMETQSVVMLNHFCEAFSSRKMSRIIPGIKEIDQCIEFEHCTVNQDFSHVTVYWSSRMSDQFAIFVMQKKDQDVASRLLSQMNENITKRLQAKEGYFRHYLIKKMDFRRVPRIFFRPYCDFTHKKEKRDMENKVTQEFLRKEAATIGDNYDEYDDVEEDNDDEDYDDDENEDDGDDDSDYSTSK